LAFRHPEPQPGLDPASCAAADRVCHPGLRGDQRERGRPASRLRLARAGRHRADRPLYDRPEARTVRPERRGRSMIRYEMDEKLLRYTFGDHPPVAEVPAGSVLVTNTQDCFAGAVRTVDDLPSAVCPAFNPVTGPFFVPGAEPGDTLALHFRTIEPSRNW